MTRGRALVEGSWIEGTIFPGFTDNHVHRGLIDATLLRANGISRVLDLGWDPATARTWTAAPDATTPVTDIAGPILTVPCGYPAESGWAPAAASRPIGSVDEVEAAVAEVLAAGGRVVKLALNSDAGPTLDDDILAAIVTTAHRSHLPVVAHTEGRGQAARALETGVDVLAHTPWTEVLDDALLQNMAGRMSWISTLDIHGWGDYGTDFDRAFGNLERFAGFGGRVHYGTDLGNGDLPVGLNRRELSALNAVLPNVVDSLKGLLPNRHMPLKTFIAGDAHGAAQTDLVEWLCSAIVVPTTEIEEQHA